MERKEWLEQLLDTKFLRGRRRYNHEVEQGRNHLLHTEPWLHTQVLASVRKMLVMKTRNCFVFLVPTGGALVGYKGSGEAIMLLDLEGRKEYRVAQTCRKLEKRRQKHKVVEGKLAKSIFF